MTTTSTPSQPVNLEKYAWLSIATATLTIALKAGAYLVSGSVGLLSDACESLVNLAAAFVALLALHAAARPADDSHHFGHDKAEYFSAAIEGLMIFVAALAIVWTAIDRLLHPQPLENVGLGLIISVVASVLNGSVAMILLKAAKAHRSITLKADGQHLLTDVWTSVGVVVGVGLVALAGLFHLDWWWLDPVVALLVGLNIIWTGTQLLRQSGDALLDASMTEEDHATLVQALNTFTRPGEVDIHGLRTRVAGRHTFAEMHLLVPGAWTVAQGHDLCEEIERAAHAQFDDLELLIHLEPLEDPRSHDDLPIASVHVG